MELPGDVLGFPHHVTTDVHPAQQDKPANEGDSQQSRQFHRRTLVVLPHVSPSVRL
jgi:hypothetical protein